MKFIYKDYKTPIVDKTYLNLLVIENPRLFFQFHKDFENQITGEDDQLSFSKADKELDFNKIGEWIKSIWDISLNERRLINRLLTHLDSMIIEEGIDQKIIKLWTEIESLIEDVISDEPLVTMNEDIVTITEILKSLSVKFDDINKENILDIVMDYILVKVQYENTKLFVFDQILGYLNNKDIKELLKFCQNEEIYILLIEANISPEIQSFPGRHVIIDNDLCDLVL